MESDSAIGLDIINVGEMGDLPESDARETIKNLHSGVENKYLMSESDFGDLRDLEKLHFPGDATHIIDIGVDQDEHYANCSIEEFQQKYMLQNSPIMSRANSPHGSHRGSRNNSCNNSDSEDLNTPVGKMLTTHPKYVYDHNYEIVTEIHEDAMVPHLHEKHHHHHHERNKYEKLTLADVEKSLSKYYVVGDNYSDELDLLITWLTGNISMLEYSGKLKLVKLWLMVIFSASISASIAFIVPFTHHDQFWNLVYICGSSALNVIVVIVLLWSRYGYHIKSFETAVSQYQLVRNMLDPSVIGENGKNMAQIRDKMETQIGNIHSQFSYVVPSEVSNMYPVLSYTNIFDLIKKIVLYRKNLVIKLRDIKNEIRYIIYKWSMNGSTNFVVSADESKLTNRELKEKKRYLFLLAAKEDTRKEILLMRNTYMQFNNLLIEEIKYAKSHKLFYTLSTFVYKKPTPEVTVPVLKDYLRLIQ